MWTGRALERGAPAAGPVRGVSDQPTTLLLPSEIMEPACPDGSSTLPDDVLIVEDDAIIALDFEDTILGFGVKTVRTAASVARALELIADRRRFAARVGHEREEDAEMTAEAVLGHGRGRHGEREHRQ